MAAFTRLGGWNEAPPPRQCRFVPLRFDRLPLGSVPERAIDALLAGPLPEAVGRSLVEHHVLQRVAKEMLDTASREGVSGGPATEELVASIVQSAAFKRALRDVLSSPEVRTALAGQATGFADELAAAIRARAGTLDERLQRRPAEQRYGGLATRGVGLVVDAALAELGFLVLAASIALVLALAGGLGTQWINATLAGAGWFLAAGAYFVFFWSGTGQTPGMRIMRVRVVTSGGASPSVLRSIVRFVGLILAIIPLLAGFLPVLFDNRRRALQDFLAGTVVVDA
jgi:uncharacterized RDD family membrane protein YckC